MSKPSVPTWLVCRDEVRRLEPLVLGDRGGVLCRDVGTGSVAWYQARELAVLEPCLLPLDFGLTSKDHRSLARCLLSIFAGELGKNWRLEYELSRRRVAAIQRLARELLGEELELEVKT
jgi:hypothetical protein